MSEPRATTLVLTRRFAAPREAVFRAWTQPAALARWFIPFEGFAPPKVELDPRPGGALRIAMQDGEGQTHTVRGVFREVAPPERLVFTWRWEEERNDVGETLVTVELREAPGGTELTLTHSGFPTPEARDGHGRGWSGCMARLEGAV